MTPWAGKRVLVTGAAGFVGSGITRKLTEQGAQVTALIHSDNGRWRLKEVEKNINIQNGDLLDQNFVERTFRSVRPEIVYNAAFPGGYPVPVDVAKRANMLAMGTLAVQQLLYFAMNNGSASFIQIGSSTEYGLSNVPHREDDFIKPVSSRGSAKAASTIICQQFASEFNFPVSILRLYAVYGPYEQPHRLVPRAMHAALTRGKLPLTPPGIMHDWIHIDDVVTACLEAGQQRLSPGEIINIGSGKQTTNEEIVKMIEDVSGLKIDKIPAAFPAKGFDTANWQADISKASALLHWTPKLTLSEGLYATLEFWKNHLDQLERTQ